MMKLIIWALALCGIAVFSPANAANSTLMVSGKITSISALQNGSSVGVPTGTVQIGDNYTLTASFDLTNAKLTALFDADPRINIYYLPKTDVTLHIGSYSTHFIPIFDFNSSIQLWNNYEVVGPVDSQSFSFFEYNASSSSIPFDLGAGLLSQSINFNAFDFSALARQDDLLSSLKPFSLFGVHAFSVGLLNFDTNLFVHLNGDVSSAQLEVAAIPEPSVWIMMIFGFAMVGVGLRTARPAAVQ